MSRDTKPSSRTRSDAPSRGKQVSPKRRARDDEVMQAAIDVFWRKGYAAASIQDVADEVGVLKGSLYYYIKSKEDLLLRIFEESTREADEIVEDVLRLKAEPLERLRVYIERYAEWSMNNLERVGVYFRQWRYLSDKERAAIVEQRRAYHRFLLGLVQEAKAQGAIPAAINTTFAAFFIEGAMNGIPDWYRRNGGESPREIAHAFAAMAIASVSNPAFRDAGAA